MLFRIEKDVLWDIWKKGGSKRQWEKLMRKILCNEKRLKGKDELLKWLWVLTFGGILLWVCLH